MQNITHISMYILYIWHEKEGRQDSLEYNSFQQKFVSNSSYTSLHVIDILRKLNEQNSARII
jgi:hypothetical protein